MIKEKITMGVIALSIVFSITSCAKSENSSDDISGNSEIKTTAASSAVENSSETEEECRVISVKALKYEDEQLTFDFEGENYTLPLAKEYFVDDDTYFFGMKLLSGKIINNKLGEEITAKLKVDNEISRIISCDVINQNGQIFWSGMLDSSPEDEERKSENPKTEELYQYTLTQVDGTIYELNNINRTLTVDLNDLNVYAKVPLPDSSKDVSFSGYLFADNQFIIQNLLFFTGYDEDGNKGYDEQNTDDFTNFFAVVQSVADDNAEILLTDGKTTCTVPTYYCEDELYEGEQIMVTLDCDNTLFGNGEHKSFDYAVIHTDSSAYNYGNLNFDTLAYAYASKNELGRFAYTTKDKLGASE